MGDALEPAQEIAVIEGRIATDRRGYFRDEPMQARYRTLVDARASGAPAPAGPSKASIEMRDIEKLMGKRDSEYWKGPKAAGLQERYRTLIDGEHAGVDADAWRMTAEQATQRLPVELVSAWRASGDLMTKVRAAEDQWSGIYHGIGDRELAAEFQVSFLGLPNSVQAAIYREAVAQPPTFSTPATAEEVAGFAKKGGGAEAAVAQWGREAATKIGRICARFDRAVATIPQADRADFFHWFQAITPRERFCLIWPLAA
jgi:hypothetical protein